MHVFCIFVFAPVQRSSACFMWKGALEIRSLLLLLLLLYQKPTEESPSFAQVGKSEGRVDIQKLVVLSKMRWLPVTIVMHSIMERKVEGGCKFND